MVNLALLFLSIYSKTTIPETPVLFSTPIPGAETYSNTQKDYTLYKVTRVIDGDTIEIDGSTKVRYIGIDTPEAGDCFGEEAKKANENLVGDKSVRLEYDVQRIDKYGRTLAYVYAGEVFVNEKLVQDGFAKVATFPPNILHLNKFREGERYARDKKLGLWSPSTCT